MKKKSFKWWTTREYRYVKDNLHQTDEELGDALGRTPSSVEGFRNRNGLIKPDNRFEKGFTPWNKGISYKAGGRSAETRFKPGQLPWNTKKDYDVTVRHHKRAGISYKYIRISQGKWMLLHRFVWEQINGSIPKGHIIIFRDGDTMNVAPENLECISMAENLRRNHNRPKASVSMKSHWDRCRTYETFGLKTSRHYCMHVS